MNITIDTVLKTITINGNVNLKEFTKEIKKILANADEYSIVCKVESYPYYPVYPINVPFTYIEQPNIFPLSTEVTFVANDFITYTNKLK